MDATDSELSDHYGRIPLERLDAIEETMLGNIERANHRLQLLRASRARRLAAAR